MSTSGGFPTTGVDPGMQTGVDLGWWFHNRFKDIQRTRRAVLTIQIIGRLVTVVLLLRILRRLRELERRR